MMRTEQEMFDLIMKIAKEDERIRAVYMHGSRANPSIERDNYSDYDIVFVVTETSSFINDRDWINNFGDITYVFEGHRNENKWNMKEINDFSRRYVWGMLFKDGNRVDLIIEIEEEAMNHRHIKGKPTVLLLDKDGCLPEIHPSNGEVYSAEKPNVDKYTACCTAFWWFLNDVAKAIARDQLPYAKELFSVFTRYTLNHMIDWHIGVQTHFLISTGKNGQYYKKYLPAELYDLYIKTYSDGNYINFWNAIFSTCDLFSKTASYVGDYFGFSYNIQEENDMMDYLMKIRLK